jgi:hypothetical protein
MGATPVIGRQSLDAVNRRSLGSRESDPAANDPGVPRSFAGRAHSTFGANLPEVVEAARCL